MNEALNQDAMLGILVLSTVVPAGTLIAGDGEASARDAAPGEYEALLSDTDGRGMSRGGRRDGWRGDGARWSDGS